MRPFQHSAPLTLSDAIAACDTTVADLMASGDPLTPRGTVPRGSGCDMLDLMKEGLVSPAHMVDVRAIPELQGVERTSDGGVRIGAAVTIAQLEGEEVLNTGAYKAVGDAAAHIAHPQIRARGTVAGSLLQRPHCWYFRLEEVLDPKKGGTEFAAYGGENQFHAIFDNERSPVVHPSTLATPFTALDARVEIAGTGGVRQVPLGEFLTDPARDVVRENELRAGEIVTAIVLPPQPRGFVSAHIKQGQRESYDWAIVDVAVAGVQRGSDLSDVRVALGAVAPRPRRAAAAEAALAEQGATPDAFRAAGRAATEGATPLSKNAYKVPILETVVRRTAERAFS